MAAIFCQSSGHAIIGAKSLAEALKVAFNRFIRNTTERFSASSQGKIWQDFYINVYLGHYSDFLNRLSDSLQDNSKVLDFGCGDGKYLVQFCGRKSCYGVGADISAENLHKAIRNALSGRRRHQTDFVQTDVNHLPFREKAFDSCFIINVFHHVSDFLSMEQLYKAMKNGGMLLIIDSPGTNPFKFIVRKMARYVGDSILGYGQTFLFFTPATLKHAVSRAGFKVVKEDFKEYFFEYFGLLFLFLPLANFISRGTLLALHKIELKLGRFRFLNEFCTCVLLYCVK